MSENTKPRKQVIKPTWNSVLKSHRGIKVELSKKIFMDEIRKENKESKKKTTSEKKDKIFLHDSYDSMELLDC